MTKQLAVVLLLIVILISCENKKQPPWTRAPQPTPPYAVPTSVPVGRYGIGCRTDADPSIVGPPNYNVGDVGKPGVPVLTKAQLRMLRRIRHYVKSKTLRFAFVDGPTGANERDLFIVFNANQGPCIDFVAGYWVMNDARDGNLYYSPGNVSALTAAPDAPPPGPWMY